MFVGAVKKTFNFVKHETCQCFLLWLWMSVGVGVTTCVGWENIRLCFGKTNWFNWYVAKNIFKNWVVDPSQTPSRSWSPSPSEASIWTTQRCLKHRSIGFFDSRSSPCCGEGKKISVKCPKNIIYHKRSQDQFLGSQFFLHWVGWPSHGNWATKTGGPNEVTKGQCRPSHPSCRIFEWKRNWIS